MKIKKAYFSRGKNSTPIYFSYPLSRKLLRCRCLFHMSYTFPVRAIKHIVSYFYEMFKCSTREVKKSLNKYICFVLPQNSVIAISSSSPCMCSIIFLKLSFYHVFFKPNLSVAFCSVNFHQSIEFHSIYHIVA